MLLVLGTLAELKAHLLTESLRAATDYDEKIAALGKGIAELFEKRTGRKFLRVVDDTVDFSADRAHFVVPRYPIEEVTRVEKRSSLAEGYVDQGTVSDFIENLSEQAGLVQFPGTIGTFSERVRLTYTGGYWIPDTPADEEEAEEQPEGSATRPHDLYFAWLLQCEYVWKVTDKLGISIAGGGGGGAELLGLSIAGVQLLPQVLNTLTDYTRRNL